MSLGAGAASDPVAGAGAGAGADAVAFECATSRSARATEGEGGASGLRGAGDLCCGTEAGVEITAAAAGASTGSLEALPASCSSDGTGSVAGVSDEVLGDDREAVDRSVDESAGAAFELGPCAAGVSDVKWVHTR